MLGFCPSRHRLYTRGRRSDGGNGWAGSAASSGFPAANGRPRVGHEDDWTDRREPEGGLHGARGAAADPGRRPRPGPTEGCVNPARWRGMSRFERRVDREWICLPKIGKLLSYQGRSSTPPLVLSRIKSFRLNRLSEFSVLAPQLRNVSREVLSGVGISTI